MSERRRSAIFGIIFGYSSILVSLARNVLFVPIYLRSISLPEYGAWLATGGALALILINDFGLAGVATQKISTAYGAGDVKSVGALAGSAQTIGLIMALGLTAVTLALVPWLPGLDSLTLVQKHRVEASFEIAASANAAGLIGGTALCVLRSLQKAVWAGSIVLVSDVANVVLTLFALARGAGLYAIADGMLVRSGVALVAAPLCVWWVCARGLNVEVEVHWVRVRELIVDSSRFFLSAVAMRIQTLANVFFVNSVLGPTSAAGYSLTVRAHETVLMLLGQLNAALVPSVTHLFGSGNFARFRAVLLRLMIFTAAITALALSTTIILDAGFLHLWVGRDAFAGQGVSILMGSALFISSLGYVAYDALVAQGKFKFVANAFVMTSLIQVLVLIGLLHRGVWIAPTATLIAAVTWGGLFWRAVGRSIGMTERETVTLLAETGRICGVAGLAIAAFLIFYPAANSWGALIAESMACMATLAGALWLSSQQIRLILREEVGTTIRALRPRAL
jgi:O-antigen/teichoic acid export membrane protein